MAAGGDVPEGHRIIGCALQLAAGEDARGVTIDQDCQQRGRMVRFRAAACVLSGEAGQIQLINHLNDKPGQVIFVQPVVQRRR